MSDDSNVVALNQGLADLREDLTAFLERNPLSEIRETDRGIAINNPWGDSTLEIRVSAESEDLIACLNSIFLPPRLTAIWHADSKDLEMIFSAFPIPKRLRERSFEYRHQGRDYRCEFSAASERLLCLSDSCKAIEAPTDTDHRNLQSFFLYQHYLKEHPESDLVQDNEPKSFWIRDINFDDNFIVEFVRELNFFMAFSDPQTPRVLIHRAKSSAETSVVDPYANTDAFPTLLRGSKLDPYLLGLWESSYNASDPFRKFIYLFQILEYCAFYTVQEDILKVIRRAIQAPDSLSRISDVAREILDAVVDDKVHETQKFTSGIERCVDPASLWKYIEPNADHFSKDVRFDGGFCLPALIKEGWKIDDFKVAWSPKFATSLRQIRNALVHAREARQIDVIAPSEENHDKLAPWLSPLRVAAMEAMVFSE